MKNDKIAICFTDPNTGKEIKTDCIERHDITIEQALDKADARNMLPKFEDISLTSGVTYISDADNYLKILEWLRRMKQTSTRP